MVGFSVRHTGSIQELCGIIKQRASVKILVLKAQTKLRILPKSGLLR